LRVEGIVGELELGREPPLIADDGVEAAVRHLLRLVVELIPLMIVRVIAVHELHGLRGIEVRRLPAEPDIEIDGVAGDVVDVSADHDLCRAVGNLRRSDLCEHFLRWCRWDWLT